MTTLLLDSVDDYLGSAAARFFGSGYRRVDYVVRETTLVGPSVRSVAAVRYPPDWSTKLDGSVLRPHLSTIDTLIFAVRAAEFSARHVHGLDAGRQQQIWVRRVDIKAPSAPVEDTLDAIGVSARHVGTAAVPDDEDRVVSTYDCRVASMRVRVELVHAPGDPVAAAGDLDELFGVGYPGLYGSGFQHQSQTLGGVEADVAVGSTRAWVVVHSPEHRALLGGPESAYGPVVSMVDSFVVALQLGQLLLYETDAVRRADSNTLWMRHTTITATPPQERPAGQGFGTSVTLQNSGLVEARGGTWRTATIAGDCLGVRTRCAVTHRLP